MFSLIVFCADQKCWFSKNQGKTTGFSTFVNVLKYMSCTEIDETYDKTEAKIGFQMLIKFASCVDTFWRHVGARFRSKLEMKFCHVFLSNADRFLTSFGMLLATLLDTIWGSFRFMGGSWGHLSTTLTPDEVPRPSWDPNQYHFGPLRRHVRSTTGAFWTHSGPHHGFFCLIVNLLTRSL